MCVRNTAARQSSCLLRKEEGSGGRTAGGVEEGEAGGGKDEGGKANMGRVGEASGAMKKGPREEKNGREEARLGEDALQRWPLRLKVDAASFGRM